MDREELRAAMLTNPSIKEILHIVAGLGLKDTWLCAGTIRNFIWNGYCFDQDTDVDVVFFDPAISYEETLKLERDLRIQYPAYRWELKNQVYMHIHSPYTLPYQSAREAMEKFPERCTAIGARLRAGHQLELFAPFGLEDIYAYRVQPTPHFRADESRMALYRARMAKKGWAAKWPTLKIEGIDG